MINSFTQSEIQWIKAIESGEKQLEELTDRKDIQITERFINFIEKILKYENLRIEKPGEIRKRLVRIHRNIPTKSLDRMNYEYVILNGLYIVQDVLFIEPEICRKYMKNPNKYRDELHIPENASLSLIKMIRDDRGREVGVTLFRDSYIVKHFIGEAWSGWDYPIF